MKMPRKIFSFKFRDTPGNINAVRVGSQRSRSRCCCCCSCSRSRCCCCCSATAAWLADPLRSRHRTLSPRTLAIPAPQPRSRTANGHISLESFRSMHRLLMCAEARTFPHITYCISTRKDTSRCSTDTDSRGRSPAAAAARAAPARRALASPRNHALPIRHGLPQPERHVTETFTETNAYQSASDGFVSSPPAPSC
jgi:hypothetical protein